MKTHVSNRSPYMVRAIPMLAARPSLCKQASVHAGLDYSLPIEIDAVSGSPTEPTRSGNLMATRPHFAHQFSNARKCWYRVATVSFPPFLGRDSFRSRPNDP